MGPYRILIVDDEEPIRKFLASLLAKYGHRCETAKDGGEALEKIDKTPFDAAVLDIVMPGIDGIALTRELLKLYPHLPVMIMTGYAQEHSTESAVAAGAREFIGKPFSNHEFILRFDKMMRDHHGEETLLTLSLTDELTGLFNRRRFFILAEQSLKVALRTKKRLSLLYMDLDNLKKINDQNGHSEGDQALIVFANILKKTFRDSDIIARIGGDEFVVLIESMNGEDKILATRLCENLKDHNAKTARPYTLSVSVGVAWFDPENPILIDELLSRADSSMYDQKLRRGEQCR